MSDKNSKLPAQESKAAATTPAAPEKSSSIQGNDNTGATQEQKEKGELNSAKTNGVTGELKASQDKKDLDAATNIDEVPAVKEAVEGRKPAEAKPQFKSSVTADGVMDEHHEDFGETRGAQLVVLGFNPDSDGVSNNLKVLAAKLINAIDALNIDGPKAHRWAAEAITNIETGAMFAVKAATSK